MNRRKEGAYYENLVAEYLKTQGYEILEKKLPLPYRRDRSDRKRGRDIGLCGGQISQK